jgi:ATP sulfurylase
VRSQLQRGELPPPEFTLPEVAEILLEFYRSLSERKSEQRSSTSLRL